MRRALPVALVATFATGCGGAPPAPPPGPTGPSTWAELAPKPALAPEKIQAEVRYEVVGVGKLPDVEALEAALAKQGLVADVGDLDDGRVVESQGVRCSVQPGPKLGDDILPSPKIEPEYTKLGLSLAQAEQLQASTGTAEIACRPSSSPILAAQVSIQTAETLVTMMGGIVRDPILGKWYTPEAWDALHGDRHFSIEAHVRVEVTGDGERRALRTIGLTSFGRSELAVYPVQAAAAEQATARLKVLADSLLQDEPPGAGAEGSLGPAKFLYVTPAMYDAHAPVGPRPAATEHTLVLVDPQGKLGSAEAVDTLVHRLCIE